MKPRNALLAVLSVMMAVFLPADSARAARTRASNLNGFAVGLGQIIHMSDYLRAYPGSRTAILSYLKLDTEDVYSVVRDLKIHADMQERAGREFWPQISLETHRLNLKALHRELSRRGSQVDGNVRTLAREIARYRDRNKWYFIRPFCEMNDATPWAHWEFGNKKHVNTPAQFAEVWKLLRNAFDEEGATNAVFLFSPLAARGVHRHKEILATLNKIPVGSIDAFSLNLYSRPMTAYGGTSPEPISFAQLARPWMKVLASSKHRGIPLAVAEMAVSNQASDAQRAKWLRDAFRFGRANGFVMMTYFNFPHRYWHIEDLTLASLALKDGMNAF